ncbi:hypothetical protein [Aliiglaciecola lipolytica]|uniref:Uncharacterized protein n=1 Tax=Aliiglaciecola lipolytica E3 TaxID=1127673 RepID=K6XTQ2_9ALTE|nr:hypothetical protein [Aliiglaciecola lipolytica]GAC15061.1 hypothetical protein GLIP_2435 [Aliiglaciecola lipolytica E3]
MKTVYQGKDKFANYTLTYSDRILVAVVNGVIGVELATRYNKDVAEIVKSVPDKYFGYIGDLTNCQAYTAEAIDIIRLAHLCSEQAGCVVDAYCVGTALSIEQLRQMREKANNPASLNDRIFENQQQCISFINSVLNDIEQSHATAE